jgi:hypothetical protein
LIHQLREKEGIHQKISHKGQYILHLMVDPHLKISAREVHEPPQHMEEESLLTI